MRKLLLLSVCFVFSGQVMLPGQDVGNPGPDFTVSLQGGGTYNLADQAGKVVFVYLFGNTCPFCIGSGPSIESTIYQAFKGNSDFTAIGLDTWNSSSNESSVSSFRNKTGITFPLAIKAGSVASDYETTYDRIMVIDKHGKLFHKGIVAAGNDINNAVTAITQSLAEIVEVDCQTVGLTISETSTPPTCHGESDGTIAIDITSGAAPYTITWFDDSHLESVSGLTAGCYNVQVSDSQNCVGQKEICLSDPDVVMAASIEGDESVNPANTHTYSITEMEGFMYHWLVMGGEITSGLGTETIDIKWGETMAGLIQVVIETDQGCVSDTAHLSIAINTVGIEGRSGHEIGIYPNPVQNILHISSSDRIHFSLTDLAGTTLMTTSDNQIDLSSLKEGIYIAVIRSNDRITTQKIIKQ